MRWKGSNVCVCDAAGCFDWRSFVWRKCPWPTFCALLHLRILTEVGRAGRSYSRCAWKMKGNVNTAALNTAFLIMRQCVHDAVTKVHPWLSIILIRHNKHDWDLLKRNTFSRWFVCLFSSKAGGQRRPTASHTTKPCCYLTRIYEYLPADKDTLLAGHFCDGLHSGFTSSNVSLNKHFALL